MFDNIISSLPYVSQCGMKGRGHMDYKKAIAKLLDRITDESLLELIYRFCRRVCR